MAAPELGQKQICPNCQAKFYDLGRRPAACPKCQTTFDPEEAVRNRRIRSRAPDYEAEEEKDEVVVAAAPDEELEEEADETPEIDHADAVEPIETDEDVEDVEGVAPAPAAADIGVDFAEEGEIEEAEDDAVPFLEDEDEEGFEEDIEGLPGEDEEPDR